MTELSAQGSFFRMSDPYTSKSAAESVRPHIARQAAEVWGIVERRPHHQATAYEIAQVTGYRVQQNVAARRLRDLERTGHVRDTGQVRPGSSGRMCIVWEAI
jgi:hypothetical protein